MDITIVVNLLYFLFTYDIYIGIIDGQKVEFVFFFYWLLDKYICKCTIIDAKCSHTANGNRILHYKVVCSL